MTPDRDTAVFPPETAAALAVGPADLVLPDEAARALAVATDPRVPAPRPEVMARVLDGLRSLPPRLEHPSPDVPAGADVVAVPLPRRCV